MAAEPTAVGIQGGAPESECLERFSNASCRQLTTRLHNQSLPPANLPVLFGELLTPDLLSDIVKTLASTSSAGVGLEDSWKLEFLRGMVGVRRFGTSAAFLDSSEAAGECCHPSQAE